MSLLYTISNFQDLYEIAKFVYFKLKNLFSNYLISGVVVSPYGGKSFCISHLKSSDCEFVDLDSLIKKEYNKSSSSGIDIDWFEEAKEKFLSMLNIKKQTSKACKKIVFFSKNYKLLKYLGIEMITYTLPSQYFIDNWKSQGGQVLTDQQKKDIAEYKQMLSDGSKLSKCFVYQSKEDLLNRIISQFNAELKA